MKCLAPWKCLSVRFNGDITPDCVYTGRNGNIHENSLRELLQHPNLKHTQQSILKGYLPTECSQCTKKEQINNHSRRIFFNELLNHVPRTTDTDIRFLEVNISNKCNLKCVMCSGVNSTAWIKEDYKLQELGIERPITHPDFGYRIIKDDIIDRLFEYPELFKNLEYVNIKGGEPFMEDSNIKLLNKLLELNLHNVTIDLSTNGTTENTEFEELLTQFKTKIHISIEGTGKLYEYISGGNNYTWEQFLSNLDRFKKFDRVILAGTVMAYNVCHVNKTLEYFNDYEVYFNNVVTTPDYLNPEILPDNILTGTGYKNNSHLDLNKFVDFTRKLDSIRGTNVLDVCPELNSIFA